MVVVAEDLVASGSGRGGYGGRGSSGRGNFRRNNAGGTSENIKKEFAPHQAGKQQKIACDSMKEHVTMSTQKTCKNGGDLATALRNGVDDTPGAELVRTLETHTATNADDETKRANIAAKQAGHDLKFTEECREYKDRKNQYDENKKKAFAWTHESLCNKAMKSRLEEMSNFDSEIRNDPFKLLDATKDKMCDPARAKCECASLRSSAFS